MGPSEQQLPTAVKWTVATSPTIGAIAKALAAAQMAMGPAIKDKVGIIPGKDGRQGYQYGYATLAACFEAIAPMHANGIAVTQIPLDGGEHGVLIATLLLHESGEWIRGEMWMPVAQQTPQGHGSDRAPGSRTSERVARRRTADGEKGPRQSAFDRPRNRTDQDVTLRSFHAMLSEWPLYSCSC